MGCVPGNRASAASVYQAGRAGRTHAARGGLPRGIKSFLSCLRGVRSTAGEAAWDILLYRPFWRSAARSALRASIARNRTRIGLVKKDPPNFPPFSALDE